ncbi:MAG: exodeoxyribonuclease VII small subunit [Halioglobus sp.]|jgi:exodeoxyribonuclease VII small subunit
MPPKAKKNDDSIKNFEASTKRLESIIDTLEADGLSLEQALKAFEEGIKLSRSAQQALEQAEQQVTLLMEESGEIVEQDISVDEEEEEG